MPLVLVVRVCRLIVLLYWLPTNLVSAPAFFLNLQTTLISTSASLGINPAILKCMCLRCVGCCFFFFFFRAISKLYRPKRAIDLMLISGRSSGRGDARVKSVALGPTPGRDLARMELQKRQKERERETGCTTRRRKH